MKEVLVSVIIPCYNVEDYIEVGIDSLINQTLKDVEFIFINDGSLDDTLNILRDYQKSDKRIKIIDKKNEGVSIARNTGLKKAKGKYICFMDSDDWYEYDFLEKLYNKIISDDYDIVACDTYMIYPDEMITVKSNICDNQSINKLMIDAYAVIWNKMYKKEILENIYFEKNISFCEDVLFLYKVYSKVKKVGSVNKTLYNYLQRENSLTYTYNEKIYDLIKSLDNIVDYYEANNYLEMYYSEIEYSYIRYLFGTFIKRMAKTRNKKEFSKGFYFVKDKVKEKFPNYKKNKYLKGKKGFYLKYFNKLFANIIFYLEKNKMN